MNSLGWFLQVILNFILLHIYFNMMNIIDQSACFSFYLLFKFFILIWFLIYYQNIYFISHFFHNLFNIFYFFFTVFLSLDSIFNFLNLKYWINFFSRSSLSFENSQEYAIYNYFKWFCKIIGNFFRFF
jgi:hypothetical protein